MNTECLLLSLTFLSVSLLTGPKQATTCTAVEFGWSRAGNCSKPELRSLEPSWSFFLAAY